MRGPTFISMYGIKSNGGAFHKKLLSSILQKRAIMCGVTLKAKE